MLAKKNIKNIIQKKDNNKKEASTQIDNQIRIRGELCCLVWASTGPSTGRT